MSKSPTTRSAVELFSSVYGPYAFGVVALLLIWFTIVRPELAARSVDYEEQATIVQQQKQIAETMSDTADTMADTVKTLKWVVEQNVRSPQP